MLRFIDTGRNNGCGNMAVDEALAGYFDKESHTILRVYGWAKPSVSIGYFQKMDEIKTQINANLTQMFSKKPVTSNQKPDKSFSGYFGKGLRPSAFYDFVRRPTGGGAVLHNGNTTFSVVLKRQNKPIEWYYGVVREAIIKTMKILTRIFNTAKAQNVRKNAKKDFLCDLCGLLRFSGVENLFCHNNITKYDVVLNGAKLAGFAARRFNNCCLLQGYIDVGYNNLLKTALIKGFEVVLGLKGFPDELTEEEEAVSIKLEGKYRSRKWNYKFK